MSSHTHRGPDDGPTSDEPTSDEPTSDEDSSDEDSSDEDTPDEERVEHRAHLEPEERAAGSDDPHRQAEIILEDSDERTVHPEETKHASTQTPD
jgi:hypothetical protein